MLYSLSKSDWDDGLLDILGVPKSMLPGIKRSGAYYGEIDFMGVKLPVCGVAGDQQSALFGQFCFEPGEMKNTYGSGVPTGRLKPLDFIRLTKVDGEEAKVRIIVPHSSGTSNASGHVQPFYYEITYMIPPNY